MAEALRQRSASSEPIVSAATTEPRIVLSCNDLEVRAGGTPILRCPELEVRAHGVTGVIGPSGAGKSTLLKCLNRLIELEPGLSVRGRVELDGTAVYGRRTDPARLRERIGILFQQPVVFPGSIARNVLFGLRWVRRPPRRTWPGHVQRALRAASLWDEVEYRLDRPATELSVGQRQRLCLARTLAMEPEVILMDEPTSSLDPASTEAIEGLIRRLAERHTIVLVTHDMDQARRVTDRIACVCLRDGVGVVAPSVPTATGLPDPGCRRAVEAIPGTPGRRVIP